MIRKLWKFRNPEVSADAVRRAAEERGVPKIIANVLLNRSVAPSDFSAFIAKSKKNIINPLKMKDMDKAAERVKTAIENKERIAVYGDYDVDGITSTALLYDFLKSCGADVIYYIPDRLDEGYGINIMAVNKLIKQGIRLMISVDCGITAFGTTEYAKLMHMDVIITDHHTCMDRLPDAADAVVNPKRPDDDYPFDGLAGVGVAFKLAMAAAMKMGMRAGDVFERYVDLAAIGTIADVVPLVDENRVIVDKGLKVLQEPTRPGIQELFAAAGIRDKKITAGTVAFSLAPRMNAAGRLGTAQTAVELLLTHDDAEAERIAHELDRENTQRRDTEAQIYKEAVEIIEADESSKKKKVLVLAHEGWHSGVIGIVASRICETYYKPAILIALTDGTGKGSGRSVEGFNLFDALKDSEELLLTFGGHSAAAGLGISEENIGKFTEAINTYAEKAMKDVVIKPTVKIDCVLRGQNLNIATAKTLSVLEPYGMSNERPVFAVKDAEIISASTVGSEGRHLKMLIEKDGVQVKCIGFGMGEYEPMLKSGGRAHLAFKLDVNTYQGNESAQLVLCDIKPY